MSAMPQRGIIETLNEYLAPLAAALAKAEGK